MSISKKKESKEVEIPPNGGWGITTDDENSKWITNFFIKVIDRIDNYSSSNAKPVTYIKLRIGFGNGHYSEEFTLPISNLGNVDWLSKDIRCMFNPDVAPAKAQRYITRHVRKKLIDVSPSKQYK